jgi:hypothetical protein
VPLPQVAEVVDCGLVRNAVVAQLDPGKAAHRVTVVEHLLRHRIAQSIPILKEVDAQHGLNRHRWAPALRAGLRIVRCDQPHQPSPGDHCLHLGQEHLPPRLLLLHRITQAGKCRLLRHLMGSLQGDAGDYHIKLKAGGFSDVPKLQFRSNDSPCLNATVPVAAGN